MKKKLYIISGVILLSLFTFPQSQSISDPKTIIIMKPVNGDAWERDIAHTIEWRINGEMGDRVKIRLFNHDGSVRIMGISDNSANNGSFRCLPNIFTNVRDGLYKIKVRTTDNSVSGLSARFWIGTPPTANRTVVVAGDLHDSSPSTELSTLENTNRKFRKIPKKIGPPSIKITYPPKNHIYRAGSFPSILRIEWEKTGIGVQDNNVKILLHKLSEKRSTKILSANSSNDGLYSHKFSRPGPVSGSYKISIQTLDGKISAISNIFRIKNQKKVIMEKK